MHKTPHARTNFGCSDVQELHAAVAQSTFVSHNRQNNTTIAKQCWEFRSGKIARRCGAKRICQSKCTKPPQSRSNFGSFDPEKLHPAVARSTFVTQNAQSATLSGHFLKFRCPKMARRCGAKRICKSKCAKHRPFAAF